MHSDDKLIAKANATFMIVSPWLTAECRRIAEPACIYGEVNPTAAGA